MAACWLPTTRKILPGSQRSIQLNYRELRHELFIRTQGLFDVVAHRSSSNFFINKPKIVQRDMYDRKPFAFRRHQTTESMNRYELASSAPAAFQRAIAASR